MNTREWPADVQQALIAHPVKSSTSSTYRSQDRSATVAAASTVIAASSRADNFRDGESSSGPTKGSLVATARTIATEHASAHPLLDELEQLIDRAWAEYMGQHTNAAAARVTSGTAAWDVEQTSARLRNTVTDEHARFDSGVGFHPAEATPIVAPEIVLGEKPDIPTKLMLRRLDALLEPFKVADAALPARPARHRDLTPTPSPTISPTRTPTR